MVVRTASQCAALLGLWAGTAVAAPLTAGDIVVLAPAAAPFSGPRVADPELAVMRGGLMLPNGFDVAIGIDIQTRIDGVLVLHTIFSSDGPITGTRVFTDGRDGDRLAPGTAVVTTPASSGVPVIVTARSPSGTTVSVTPQAGAAIVNLVDGPQSTWVTAEGQTLVPVTADGAPVTTGPGTFRQTSTDAGTVITLDTGDLQVRHLIGQATGAVVANTANNRDLDTIASVNVDLGNVAPLLAASLFANEALALQLVRGR
ncbi:hypothetical protein [Sphingomonas profundi]|uniref:hypothetical protein n=1 Tax=Alterirhizorhabdus profundi TaxID=2681549 RepID=UPI0012E78202|nr:hypothetical protein [Sphingomonas profundi]